MLSYFVVHDPFGAVQAFGRQHLYMCTFAKLQLSPLSARLTFTESVVWVNGHMLNLQAYACVHGLLLSNFAPGWYCGGH